MENKTQKIRSTTILAVQRDGAVALAGDGQVSLGQAILKSSGRKIRTLHEGKVATGFAGSTADALTLFDRFEAKLGEYRGQLVRAAVELAKDWRTDRYLRRLEAMMIVADSRSILTLSGNGDVIEPDDGIAAIGSGGFFALTAARALKQHTQMSAEDIVRASMKLAADICVYTNDQLQIEVLRG